MNSLLGFLTCAWASGLFLSYLPERFGRKWGGTGAGLVGTGWGLFTIRWLPTDFWRQGMVLTGAFCLAAAISDYAEERLGRKDDPRIVIDEWIGFWISAAFLPRTPATLAALFVLFRVLDVWKPAGIRRLGNLAGGWGVVLDDVLAAAYANGLVRLGGLILTSYK